MPWLICYDISDDQLRTKVAKQLTVAGLTRLQYSVFGGDTTESIFQQLFTQLQQDMTTFAYPSDSILFFEITDKQVQNCTVLGHDALDRDDLSGEQHTLIL